MDLLELEKVGLKEKEAKVFIALLREGPSLANHIAKKTKILRSSIYDYLDILLDKGFVSYTIKSGKKYFQATDPERILEKFKEQKEKEEESLKSIIPSLIGIKNKSIKTLGVEVFEGRNGLKSAFLSILRNNPDKILVHGSSGISHKILPFFMGKWHRQRIKQKIPMKIIFNNVAEAKERVKKGPPMKLIKFKFSQINNLSLTGTLIYADKILIHVFFKDCPVGILIHNKELNETYRKEFQILWKQAVRE